MTLRISDRWLANLSELIVSQMGLYFPEERWRDLERGITSAATAFGFQEAETCIKWLVASPLTKTRIEVLANHLTVGETYFFREYKSLEILRDRILPELIGARQQTDPRLRIWSAGCCTGEEPYSIAILLRQMLPKLEDWNISILATDINPSFLQKAARGIYSEWSFREPLQLFQERYFKRTKDGRFEILPEIKKMVNFSYLNLAEDVYPSLCNDTNAMDVIFCRNVLMYFSPELAKLVTQKFHRSAVNGGWLIVSQSELSHNRFLPFMAVAFPAATLYRKGDHQARPANDPWYESVDERALWPELDPAPAVIPDQRPEFSIDLAEVGLSTAVETEETAVPPSAYQEALALYEHGRYEEASEKLLTISSRDRDHADAMLLARVFANQGRLTEALRWCEEALNLDKLSREAHYLRAVILQERGASEEAERALRRTLYLDPEFVLAHFALGNLTLRRGRAEESLRHFENALSLLRTYRPEELLPGSEGVTAGGLAEAIRSNNESRSGT